ncbi:unnamed protein product [Lymnaea stagnalis]|uniref:Uncharacterized protein n=1 Tax=Lymnaea stagnalis TaxID=6523 RepID=A0AAV2IKW5_LYMST
MGQNSSAHIHVPATTPPRGRQPAASVPRLEDQPRQEDPPPAPEAIPKTPTYVVPENKVLPNGSGDVVGARRSLRPVSQELTKLHPEFADIFNYESDPEFEGDSSSLERSLSTPRLDKENSSVGLSASGSATDLSTRGFSPRGNTGLSAPLANVTNGHVLTKDAEDIYAVSSKVRASTPNLHNGQESWSSLRRANSMDRVIAQPNKYYRHSRQTSLTSGISLQDTVILEDPREHLYNIARHEPFSNLMPSTTSLPVPSTFDMDYSLNLTYAQLAEHRRQKRAAELEGRTGKKMEELSAEITASSTVPKSPFDRQNLGMKSSTHSVSTGSSETGVSKSKKKKAPAPPPPPVAPFRYSFTHEPPADYEMQEHGIQHQKAAPQPHPTHKRSNSSVSGIKKPPAPQPLPKRHSLANLETAAVVQKPAAPEIPLPKSMSDLFTKSVASAGGSSPALATGSTPAGQKDTVHVPGHAQLQRSMSEAKRQIEVLKKLEDALKNPKQSDSPSTKKSVVAEILDTVEDKSFDNETKEQSHVDGTSNTNPLNVTKPLGHEPNVVNSEKSTVANRTSEESPSNAESVTPIKRMSSLLQHDIVLAAQARGAKVIIAKATPTLERPKDASELFRDELAKAASAREERRKVASDVKASEDESVTNVASRDDKVSLFKTSEVKVSKRASPKASESHSLKAQHDSDREILTNGNVGSEVEKPSEGRTKEELDQEYIEKTFEFSKRPSIQSEDMSISSSNNSQRMFSPNWTPEEDLESDDDIREDTLTMTHRRVPSEGFKSSILPTKLHDLKNEATTKQQKKKNVKSQDDTEKSSPPPPPPHPPPVADKPKFGSVRKFKRNIHQSMRNAFGSISKASGKLMKKHKSREAVYKADTPPDSPTVDETEHNGGLDLSNWVLSDSRSGSLRRTASDRYIERENEYETSPSESSGESDVGDIDFASGIDKVSNPRKNSRGRGVEEDQPAKGMKRAGVAYVSGKGQIIVLPEFNTVKVDKAGNVVEEEDDGGHAPKIFKKKSRKFKYESTVRVQEKNRLELQVAKEIREKERQIEMDRLLQQTMERDFRRLRDLETKERLQRMQTETMKEQITLMQRQQLQNEINNNAGNLNGSAQMTPVHGPVLGNGHVSTTPYVQNEHTGGGYINSLRSFGGPAPQNAYTTPPFPTTVLGHAPTHMPHPTQYTSHSAPLVGNNLGLGAPQAPQLTSQELSHISDYMRMMGVAPPTNQQQWAVLLSTISFNSTGFPGYDQKTAYSGIYGMGTGPDLSHIFGTGKSMESTTSPVNRQVISVLSGKPSYGDLMPVDRHSGDNVFYNPMQMLSAQSQMQQVPSITVIEDSPRVAGRSFMSGGVNTSDQTRTPGVPGINGKANGSVDLKPVSDLDYTAPVSQNSLSPGNTGQNSVKSPTLSPKVYGPIGFRPVAFNTGST